VNTKGKKLVQVIYSMHEAVKTINCDPAVAEEIINTLTRKGFTVENRVLYIENSNSF
jgi:molecular chaperone GrpE (heat shock protein)